MQIQQVLAKLSNQFHLSTNQEQPIQTNNRQLHNICLNSMGKVELPLPKLYTQYKKICRIFNSILLLSTLADMSLLLGLTYQHKVERESMYLCHLGILLIISSYYLRESQRLKPKKIFQHPATLSILSLCIPVFLRCPYDSVAIIAVNLLLSVATSFKYSKNVLPEMDPIFFGFLSGLVSIQCLIHGGFLTVSIKPISFMFGCFIVSLQLLALVFLLRLYFNDTDQNKLILNINKFRVLYVEVMLIAITMSLLLTLSKDLVTQNFLAKILLPSVAFTLTISLINMILLQQIALICSCPLYSPKETIFRAHYRAYCRQYQPSISQRTQQWNDQLCLLCDKIARIVVFPCGHLTVCIDCHERDKKNYSMCLICEQVYFQSEKLEMKTGVRCGYNRKIFIQKKLRNNEERIVV